MADSQETWGSDMSGQMDELTSGRTNGSDIRRQSPHRAAQPRDDNGQPLNGVYKLETIEKGGRQRRTRTRRAHTRTHAHTPHSHPHD